MTLYVCIVDVCVCLCVAPGGIVIVLVLKVANVVVVNICVVDSGGHLLLLMMFSNPLFGGNSLAM